MPTKKPKIQGYLNKLINERFVQWKQERLIEGNTEALNQILAEYFGLGTSSELIIQQKEAAEEFFPKLKEELKQEILAEVNHQLEAIDKRIGEIEAQFEQERESPKESPEELVEIPELQSLDEGDGLKNGDRVKMFHHNKGEWLKGKIRKLEGKDCWVIWDTDAEKDKPWCPGYRYPIELIELDREFPDNPPEEISLEDCQEKAIAILEAQLGQLSKAKLETYSEQQLMDIIFITSPLLNIEQAEEVLRRILEAIPATPPLHEIIGAEEDEVELNLEGDSPEESPEESPLEELSHSELVERLKTNKNTLRSKRNQPDFAVWAQQRDNRGLIWHWVAEKKIYQGFRPKPV